MTKTSDPHRGLLGRLMGLLLAGLLGGVSAVALAAVLLLTAGYPLSEPRPSGHVDPSAAVAGSLATLIKASAVFAAGAALGAVARGCQLYRRNAGSSSATPAGPPTPTD